MKTLERRRRSRTGGRSALRVVSISAISMTSGYISKCLN